MVERQIPELAAAIGISEQEVVRDVMLRTTADWSIHYRRRHRGDRGVSRCVSDQRAYRSVDRREPRLAHGVGWIAVRNLQSDSELPGRRFAVGDPPKDYKNRGAGISEGDPHCLLGRDRDRALFAISVGQRAPPRDRPHLLSPV